MGTRRTPRKVGRPTLITDPDVSKNLTDALRLGVPISLACQAAGISESVFYKWTARGRDAYENREAFEDGDPQAVEPDQADEPFLALYAEIRKARVAAAVRNVGVIQKVAQGGTVLERTTERDPDGTERVIEKRQAPDWRAAAWYLERSHRGEFGKPDQLEVTGAGGGPIQVTVDAADLSDRLARHLEAGIVELPALTAGDTPDDGR